MSRTCSPGYENARSSSMSAVVISPKGGISEAILSIPGDSMWWLHRNLHELHDPVLLLWQKRGRTRLHEHHVSPITCFHNSSPQDLIAPQQAYRRCCSAKATPSLMVPSHLCAHEACQASPSHPSLTEPSHLVEFLRPLRTGLPCQYSLHHTIFTTTFILQQP